MGLLQKLSAVAVLFCLADVSSAVQDSLHYTYHYRARVESGIPEINSHHLAASDIRADLNVYVSDVNDIIFKFDNVEIGEYHGVADCELELDQPLPVEYRVPTSEEPGHYIGLHPFGFRSGTEFQFYESEPLWLVNFYKSVVALLFPATVRYVTYYPTDNYTEQSAFKVTESQIFGTCDSTYTQHKLVGVAANQYKKWFDDHVSEDVQLDPAASTSKTGRKTTGRKTTGRKTRPKSIGRKTTSKTVKRPPSAAQVNVPLIDPTVRQIIKSVNLEDCSDTVEHQHTLTGVHCSLSKDQCKNTMSRNSHSVFYVRGDKSGMRVEKVIVKGAILVSPLGYESDMLRTRTFQKLALESVSELGSIRPTLDFQTQSYSDMIYTMILPYKGIGTNPKESRAILGTLREALEEFTAYPITPYIQESNQERVVQLITYAYGIVSQVGQIHGTTQTQTILNYAAILLYDFSEQEVEVVVQKVKTVLPEQGYQILNGVLAEVGSTASIKALVKSIEEGHVAPFTQALLFGSLNINLKSAKPLRILLDYLKVQDLDAEPFKLSQSYVNFADSVYHFCVQDNPNSGSFGEFAHLQCEQDNILPEFENLLISQLENTDKFWKQMVLVKSLTNLRSKRAFETLLPFVLGQKNCDTTVRLVALEILSSWNAPCRTYRDRSTLILLDLFENPVEDGRIRARALGFLVSWPLSSTIWSRLAFSTHRPLLRDLAGFTYSLIESVSKFKHPEALRDGLYASHALRLAQPMTASRRYSSYKTWYKYCFKNKMATLDHIETVIDPLSPIPSALSVYMRRVLGGSVIYSKMDFMIANEWGDIVHIIFSLMRSSVDYRDLGESGNWDRFLNMLTSGLDLTQRIRDPIVGMMELIPSNGIDFFIPFEQRFLKDIYDNRLSVPHSTYYNSFGGTLATVNDIGFPVIISVVKPVLATYNGHTGIMAYPPYEYYFLSHDFSLSFSVTSRVHMETLAMGSGKRVAAGFSRSLSLQLPFNIVAALQLPFHLRRYSGFHFILKYSKVAGDAGFRILSFASSPYTTLCSTSNEDLANIQENTKEVLVLKSANRLPETKIRTAFGIDVYFSTDDVNLFSKRTKLKDMFMLEALATTKSTVLEVDLVKPLLENTKITLNITMSSLDRNPLSKFVSDYGQDSYTDSELCGATEEFQDEQQTGQTTYDYTQQSSNDVEFQTFQSQDYGSFGDFDSQQSVQSPQRLVEDETTDAEIARASYGAPTADLPIVENYMPILRREKGWQETIYGYSVRAEIEHGSFSDAYEVAMMATKCSKILDKQNWKGIFIFGAKEDPCATMCAEFDILEPKFNDLDTLDSLSKKDLIQTHLLQTFSGPKCKDGPFLEQNDTIRLTKEEFNRIVSEILDCGESSNDPIEDFARMAYYDHIVKSDNIYHKNVERTCPKGFYEEKLRKIHDFFVERTFFKNTNLAMCDTWSDDIKLATFSSQKEHTSGVYFGSVERTYLDDTTSTRNFHLKYPAFHEYTHNKVVSLGYEFSPADYCVINETSLVTFDGLHTSFSVDGCPALAVTSCEAGSFDKFAVGVMASRTGGLAVNIVARYRQLIINVDSEGVDVNGKKIDSEAYYTEIPCKNCKRYKISGYIYYRNGNRKVEVKDTLSVILKDGKVFIKIAPRYNGYICGLCGNHDNEPVNDMKQPNGCLLTDAEKFRQAWIPQSSFSCFSEPGESADQCLKEEHVEQDTYPEHNVIGVKQR